MKDFKKYDRVRRVGNGARGVVLDLDKGKDRSYGVLFEDVDEDRGENN